MAFRIFYLIGFTVVFLMSCKSNMVNNNGTEFFKKTTALDFETVKQGRFSSGEKQNVMFRNEEDFATFWQETHQGRMPVPDVPAIDFNTQMVLAALMGTQSTGGYAIEITRIGVSEKILGVEVKKQTPGDNCFTTQALTNPYHIVKTSRFDGKVVFFEKEVTTSCDQ